MVHEAAHLGALASRFKQLSQGGTDGDGRPPFDAPVDRGPTAGSNPWSMAAPDGVIDLLNDILGVINHYSPTWAPPYDAAFDRGPTAGPNAWNMTAPDGVIDLLNDILGVITQYNPTGCT